MNPTAEINAVLIQPATIFSGANATAPTKKVPGQFKEEELCQN